MLGNMYFICIGFLRLLINSNNMKVKDSVAFRKERNRILFLYFWELKNKVNFIYN